MAAHKQTANKRPLFKRYSALQALEEVLNDSDSEEEDFMHESDSESDEEETDFNQHHPLLANVADDETESESASARDSDSESSNGEENAVPGTSRPIAFPFVPDNERGRGRGRERARGRGRNRGQQTRGRGRGAVRRGRQEELVKEWKNADDHAPNANMNFLGNPGIKCDTNNFKAVDFMELFIDDDLLNHLVTRTNLYADQYIESHPNIGEYSRVHKWEKVERAEMKKFLALVLLMGIVHLPEIEMYWSKKILYNIPIFHSVMARNRFEVR